MSARDVAPPRRHRRRRWLLGGLVVLLVLAVLVVGGIGVYLKSSAEPPLGLPASAAAPAGSIEGTWTAGTGSTAGFRIEQTVLGMTGDVVGRTTAVRGSATVANGEVTAGSFEVDLTTITANGKRSPQFDQTLQTQTYPQAAFRLTRPVALSEAFDSGSILTTTAAGQLTLRGVTRDVSVPISARRDGATLAVAGLIPVTFADWGIPRPAGYGALGSLAGHGAAEFLLILSHTAA